jgi:hypothetical protein
MAERKINLRPFECAETVPAYSIVAIASTDTKAGGRRIVYTVEKATSTSTTFGATSRFDGQKGAVNLSEDMLVRYTGTLAVGDRVRPKVGDWVVEKNSAGNFVVVGLVERDTLQLASIRLDPIKGGLRMIKAPSGGIPGRVGSLMGGAICDIVTFDANGQLTVSSDAIKVFNWASSAVCANGDRYGIAGWVNSAWLIVAEDCNDGGSTLPPVSGGRTTPPVGDAITTTISPITTTIAFREVRYSGAGAGSGFE